MAQDQTKPSGTDLTQGLALMEIPFSGIVGHVGDEEVLLVRTSTDVFAVSPHCTHYHGPLGDGLIVEETVRCPWHHACFDLRTGVAIAAPAFEALACWEVERRGETIVVQRKRERPKRTLRQESGKSPLRIVIVGGGAGGFAAAEMLRREGYSSELVMLSSDSAAPVDRPNLSKDYLAGKAPEDWIPLRGEPFYSKNDIDLRLNVNVASIDARSDEVVLADGARTPYDRLLLATGAEPVRLTIPGADQPHVQTLRSFADCKAIIEGAKSAGRTVIIGASFIGLEVAASLRARKLEVHVVAPDKRPMERILGPDMGNFICTLHEEHGVNFHLENKAVAIDDKKVRLESGDTVEADLVDGNSLVFEVK